MRSILLLASFLLFSAAAADTQECPPLNCCGHRPAYVGAIDVSSSYGKSIGVDKCYSSLGIWLGRAESDYLYFLDTRWHHLYDGSNGADAGLGVRFGDGCKGCGANVYLDWRSIDSARFRQVSAGLEGWIYPWEFHLNVYLPLETVQVLNRTHIDYEGGYFFRSKTTAEASQLCVLEVGRTFAVCPSLFPGLTCTALAGPYYISNKEKNDRCGGMASLNFRFYDYLYCNAVYTGDSINHSRFQGVVGISIPLGCLYTLCDCTCTSCCSPIYTTKPHRLDMIGINKYKKCRYNWVPTEGNER